MHKTHAALLILALTVSLSSAAAADPTPAPALKASQIQEVVRDRHPFILDVRNPEELQESGALEGSLNIPVDDLSRRLQEVPKDRPILVT